MSSDDMEEEWPLEKVVFYWENDYIGVAETGSRLAYFPADVIDKLGFPEDVVKWANNIRTAREAGEPLITIRGGC